MSKEQLYIRELSVKYRNKRVPKIASNILNQKIASSGDVAKIFSGLKTEPVEKAYVVHLDNKNVIQSFQLISVGSFTAAIVNPSEVFRSALLSNCIRIILIHNHPSGDPTPSRDDKNITERLKEAGELICIKLLDHVIIGNNKYYSLEESNVKYF